MCSTMGAGCNATDMASLVKRVNMFPELIRMACTEFGAWGAASASGDLLQLRALDLGGGPFGNWTVLAVYAGGEVALERRWARWSLLVLANPAGRSLALRRPLGDVGKISLARYDLAAVQPDYFQRAASDPKDYIGQRIITDSEHGEASFLTAAKFLPPIADFVVIGDTGAPVKAVVAMDGTVKRSDGGDDSRGQCCHLDAPQYAEWIVVNGMQWGHLNGSTAHG